ncbi:MAG: mannose-1-phosphate guanylyltransferase [Desulfobacterota bacterium]|nr:mannose-1-phosphate guanylyltransferase [Thermodesulfobacteriota bacterium]MDW8001711.1 mannose-1-phosphate guanylyltransferase [Deltaproteobacteria bacterium]
MTDTVCAVIMAGGKGERFWPLSTPRSPKPFLKLIDGNSLIELTYERLKKVFPEDRIFFVLAQEHLSTLKELYPNLKSDFIIVEPEGRDTAACIAYSVFFLNKLFGDPVVAFFPADHYIGTEDLFKIALLRAVEIAKETDFLLTFGIRPTRPEIGYGYIRVGEVFSLSEPPVYRVQRFVEKPSLEKAKEYLEAGDFYWNSGIFVWRTSAILREIERCLPQLFEGLKEALSYQENGDFARFSACYKRLPRISIDYGVMEKSTEVLMVKGDFVWDDVGTWASLFRILKKDENSLVRIGNAFVSDVKNSIIISDDLNLGVLGVDGLIVVAAKNGVLVCTHEYAGFVRELARYFLSDDL